MGTFDLLHAGHVKFLEKCAVFGPVTVGLNTDRYATSFKKQPVLSYSERRDALRGVRYVNDVQPNSGLENWLINWTRPSHIVYAVSGTEYTRSSYLERIKSTEESLEALGVTLVFLNYSPGISTSEVIERVVQRHCRQP